jgi:hypothetical protein
MANAADWRAAAVDAEERVARSNCRFHSSCSRSDAKAACQPAAVAATVTSFSTTDDHSGNEWTANADAAAAYAER